MIAASPKGCSFFLTWVNTLYKQYGSQQPEKDKLKFIAMGLLTKLLFAACLLNFMGCKNHDSPKGNESNIETIRFDFADGLEDWRGDFADYPADNPDFYELEFEHSTLPSPLDQNSGAIKQSGNNHSDDLFMFVKKKISGLTPNQNYRIKYTIEFASNVPDGSLGVGGSPGEAVTIKAGASKIEPEKVLQNDNYYRMNIDIGNQSNAGSDMIVLGDFSNDTQQAKYRLKNLSQAPYFEIQANANGEFWLIVGTDSGFESTTTIYYNKISVEFK